MATDNLELRLASSTMAVQGTTTLLSEKWQAWVPALGVVTDDFTKSVRASVGPDLDAASAKLYKEVNSWFVTIQAWHAPRLAIDDYSAFDASHIMEYWTFTPSGANFDLSHPISGVYANQAVTKDGDRPTITGRINAILAVVPGPTMWAQADSPSTETLRVTCQPVTGADSYNVYSDLGNGTFELLGSVPDAGVNSIPVSAGSYRVRMAAVTAGAIVGILSNTVSVTVAPIVAAVASTIASTATTATRHIIRGMSSIATRTMMQLLAVPAIPLCSQWLWRFIQKLRGRI